MRTNRRIDRFYGILGVLLTSLLFSMPAISNCEVGGSTPGSPLRDSTVPGTGAGGTGRQDSADPGTGAGGTAFGGEDGTGTGGTGLGDGDGTGTGGTGIFGIVTGFGSVCVNGLEVEYDEQTRIRQDGQSASVSDLAVGQTVRIQTTRSRPLFAARIDVESALSGPIDRIEASSRRVWIMDRPVELRPGGIVFDRARWQLTKLESLEPGNHLSVSGLRRTDGVVAASRIDRRAPGEPAIITALVRDLGQGTAYVGDVRTSFDPVDPASGATRDGRRMRVQGRWNSQTRTLEAERIEDAAPFDAGARRVSIQGFAAPSRSDADLRLAGTDIEIRSSTAAMPEINVDALVRIEGELDDRGRVRADRIIVDTPGRQGHPLRSSRDAGTLRKGKQDRSDRSGRGDREDREDRGDRERSDRPERSDRSGRPERSDRSGRSGR